MPIKMIANRPLYRPDEGREYAKGESFMVATEAEKVRLVKSRRASVDETKDAPVKPMKRQTAEIGQKVLTPEEPVAPAAEPTPVVENSQPEFSRPNRYRRSDLRAED